MPSPSEELWLDLWKRSGVRGSTKFYYNDLVKRYSESHRAYHNLKHIEACLVEFEEVRGLAVDPKAIEFAIWYHDAVYDTKRNDNEEKSCQLAIDVVRKFRIPINFGRVVLNHIMATKHSSVPTHPDTQLFVDIDLSILGKKEERFDKYEEQIRFEYSWVPREQFNLGRSAILKSFLERPRIYSTDFFFEKYEAQARLNIERSLKHLTA